jgi:hypothetical protein
MVFSLQIDMSRPQRRQSFKILLSNDLSLSAQFVQNILHIGVHSYSTPVFTVPRVSERRLGPTPPGREHHGGADGELRVIQQGEHLRDLLVRDELGTRGLFSNLLEIRPSQV